MGTIILADDLTAAIRADVGHAVVVRTPLNMITYLENPTALVDAVVLAGRFRDPQLAAALRELYPHLHVELAVTRIAPAERHGARSSLDDHSLNADELT
jgi:hypothetical protein